MEGHRTVRRIEEEEGELWRVTGQREDRGGG